MWAVEPTVGTNDAKSDRSQRRWALRIGTAGRGRGRCGRTDLGRRGGDTPIGVQTLEAVSGLGRFDAHPLLTDSVQRTAAPVFASRSDHWIEWGGATTSDTHRKDLLQPQLSRSSSAAWRILPLAWPSPKGFTAFAMALYASLSSNNSEASR